MRRHLRRRGPQRASAAPPATALRPCRAARAVALARVTGRRLCPTPSRAGALRRRAVEERQRWRRPRHLVPWRRRPSPASPRAPAQHGSPSIAMRAAAKCLASMSTQLRPVDSTTYRDEERREAGNHRRSASATPGPAGRFAVASTPPKGCSAAMGKGHHSYSLPTAAHREQDMEARRETRGAPRARGVRAETVVDVPARPSTPRHPRGTGRLSGCK